MFNSIFVGLSGMNAFSSGLRQISNNITNLNSTGFKSSNVQFGDLVRTGYDPNSVQGQGVQLGKSRTNFSQGELRQTSRGLDLAIDGQGFFILLRNGEHFLTRTGSFEVDANGDIVLAGTDYKLASLGPSGIPQVISITQNIYSPPVETTSVKFTGNLSSSAGAGTHTIPLSVFDKTGASINWRVIFTRDETSIGTAPPKVDWIVEVRNASNVALPTQRLKFVNGAVVEASKRMTFADAESGLAIEFDFSQGVSPFANGNRSDLAVAANGRNGRDRGDLTDVTVNAEGKVELVYSNQDKIQIGDVAVAKPAEPQALGEVGRGIFRLEDLSDATIASSFTKGVGKVVANRIEASNVDLSKEFGDLILIQRGYQASSQIVSASNEMIQQLFGIRGQG
ncbi:flagellar hook-basal body complex protein [Candidatus Phycosocius spiralis]|uniref:Flagellar hook protein FlgE n=1 Tax=Candidatus Phycosocius spiralis TaxID=2815099 RepID=A0ABQ4PYJ9_9PROT|nr:flagellar hook-basal body complex protein [Candidatus Phycosocius spiralis]GIU68050.1 flagellar hook protein FlgE [Candidatus Phycosocius spiralis]